MIPRTQKIPTKVNFHSRAIFAGFEAFDGNGRWQRRMRSVETEVSVQRLKETPLGGLASERADCTRQTLRRRTTFHEVATGRVTCGYDVRVACLKGADTGCKQNRVTLRNCGSQEHTGDHDGLRTKRCLSIPLIQEATRLFIYFLFI